jgi:predicted alpha/beta-fold hydrolase
MSRIDSEKNSYRPAWWLPGAHSKTIWGRIFRRTPAVKTSLLTLDTPDGDFLELMRVEGQPGMPRLVVLHGLEGSPRSHYAKALLFEAQKRKWGADLIVFRSCGTRMNKARRFYHSGETGDLDFVVGQLLREFRDVPIVLAGVSLGGNVLLKWLGERGSDLPDRIKAAAAISVPFDLARSSRHISAGFSKIYERVFLRSLRAKAVNIKERFPDLLRDVDLAGISTLWEFDNRVTAPIHGFENAEDYYAKSSSLGWIDGIRIPTLLLSAVDDPFLPKDVLSQVYAVTGKNSFLEAEFVAKGGHVGFVAGRNPFRPRYYAESRACMFLQGRCI